MIKIKTIKSDSFKEKLLEAINSGVEYYVQTDDEGNEIEKEDLNPRLVLSNILEFLENETKKKEHRINIKGYFNKICFDTGLEKKFQDVVYGNGQIVMYGKDEEEAELLDWLVTNEGKLGFKII